MSNLEQLTSKKDQNDVNGKEKQKEKDKEKAEEQPTSKKEQKDVKERDIEKEKDQEKAEEKLSLKKDQKYVKEKDKQKEKDREKSDVQPRKEQKDVKEKAQEKSEAKEHVKETENNKVHVETVQEIKNEIDMESRLKRAGNSLIVVDFYATWCRPCKMAAPQLERLAEEFKDVTFLKVDIDEVESLTTKYEVTTLPTFVFIKQGKVLETIIGSNMSKVEENVKKHRVGSV